MKMVVIGNGCCDVGEGGVEGVMVMILVVVTKMVIMKEIGMLTGGVMMVMR